MSNQRNLIFKKPQLTDIKSIAEHITQTHARNVFKIMLIAAVTAYGKSQNAPRRTIKLGNNQDIVYSAVSNVFEYCLCIQYIHQLTVHETIF